jgi:hypothetical protein
MGISRPHSAARYANACHTSGNTGKDPLFSLFAGYMRRDVHRFPKQGLGPWQNTHDYAADKRRLREPIDADGVPKFTF